MDKHIKSNQIHIWWHRQTHTENNWQKWEPYLTPEEIKAASRLRLNKVKSQYILSHALVRQVLHYYTHIPILELKFKNNAYGKPYLKEGSSDIYFNISHSQELLVIACCRQCDIGIDIEYHRPIDNIESLAKRFFSVDEVDWLLSRPGQSRHPQLFKLWTHKEAFIKGLGQGLSLPLNQFTVIPSKANKMATVQYASTEMHSGAWYVYPIKRFKNYSAAVASLMPNITILYKKLDEDELYFY